MSWMLRTILVISLVALPLYLYIALRVASSIGTIRPPAKRRARRTALGVIAWLFTLPVVALLLYLLRLQSPLFLSSRPVGVLDFLFYYPAWISLIVVLELFPLFLVLEIAALISRFVHAYRDRARTLLAWLRIGLASFAILYIPIRSTFDTNHVRDTEFHLSLPRLPAELENLRITLIGDIQVDRYTGDAKVGQVHAIVARHHPDLLLSAGDLVTSGTTYLKEAEAAISVMKGSLGTFGVMGDHDYWSAPEQVRELQIESGWTFLPNEHHLLSCRGRTICISGLTHIYADRLTEAELDSFLNSAPSADLRILLMHQPAERVIHRAAQKGYDLILAGHTHGGQIVFHPLGFTLTPSMRETRYYTGVHRVDSATVVVTNGVGISIAPIRYHAPAEVTTIVLGK
jgi:predicted MPP superfamily phosphohydrolase